MFASDIFSTLAFKLLPGGLPAGTANFEFQRAATVTSDSICSSRSEQSRPCCGDFSTIKAGRLSVGEKNMALGLPAFAIQAGRLFTASLGQVHFTDLISA
jgi:hypothetical protein